MAFFLDFLWLELDFAHAQCSVKVGLARRRERSPLQIFVKKERSFFDNYRFVSQLLSPFFILLKMGTFEAAMGLKESCRLVYVLG